MPDERGSEYSPTFVYRREKKEEGTTTRMPRATDLHIVFTKGGVAVTDKGCAEKSDRRTNKGNEVHLTFPPDKKIDAGNGVDPMPQPKNGDDAPDAPTPEPGSSCRPTFRHADPDFPPIDHWYWTHTRWNGRTKQWENYEGPHHQGNPTGWEHD